SIGSGASIGLSLMLASSSIFMAKGSIAKQRALFICGTFIGIMALAMIAFARFGVEHEGMNGENVSNSTDAFMFGLNILCWFFAFVFESNRKLRQAYFRPEQGENRAIEEATMLEDQFEHKRRASSLKLKAMEHRYEANILGKAFAEHGHLDFEKDRLEASKEQMNQQKGLFLETVEKIKAFALANYADHFQRGVSERRPGARGFQTNTVSFFIL